MFLVLSLFFSVLLLCSFSGLQELFQRENGSTMLVFLVWKMSKIWVSQTTANREKKRPNAIRKQHKCLYEDNITFIQSIVDARQLYLAWHKEAKVGVAVSFPLPELAIKTFCVACAKAGFSCKRILNNIFRGLCMWVSGHQNT